VALKPNQAVRLARALFASYGNPLGLITSLLKVNSRKRSAVNVASEQQR
jgi:hypothetical protein